MWRLEPDLGSAFASTLKRTMPHPPFVTYCLELLAGVGPVRARAMFGGHGIYARERMFALIADQTLYLKVDDHTKGAFEAEGSGPFVWTGKDGRRVTMSYWEMPVDGMESPDAALPWARLGVEAAER